MQIQPPKNEKWFLTAGVLFDGAGQESLPNPMVVIEQDRILDVLSGDRFQPPSTSFHLNLPDAAILPGLIDCHFHAAGDPVFQSRDWVLEPRESLLSIVNNSLKHALKSGITTVRDCGSPRRVMAEALSAIEERINTGPHIISCNQAIQTNPNNGCVISLGKAATIKETVEMAVDGGASFIKVLLHGCIDFTGFNPHSQFDPTLLQSVVDEAHLLNKKVSAQVYTFEALEAALAAGADILEVAAPYSENPRSRWEEAALRMVKDSIFIVPTLDHIRSFYTELERMLFDMGGESLAIHSANVREMYRMGLPVGAGSNRRAQNPETFSLTAEIANLAQASGSNQSAIRSATGMAAKIAGIDHQYGSIQPGKRADILVVRGNPLININNLDQVLLVVKDGLIVEENISHEKEVERIVSRDQG